jgi:hypothetical protein
LYYQGYVGIDFECNFSASSQLGAQAASIPKFIFVHFQVMGTSGADFEIIKFSHFLFFFFVTPAAPILRNGHQQCRLRDTSFYTFQAMGSSGTTF